MRRMGLFVALFTFVGMVMLLTSTLAWADEGSQTEAERREIEADRTADNAPAAVVSEPLGGLCSTGVEVPLYFSDFEADNGGWTASGFASWEHGVIVPGVYEGCDTVPSPEPSGPYSGVNVWGTNLNGCYANANSDTILGQTFDFSTISPPIRLSWQHWYHVFETFDWTIARVNGTQLWRSPNSTASNAWLPQSHDLSAYAGNPSVNIEFLLHATTVVNRMGWYVDDVQISYCANPSIVMTKTVGTDPSTCATTDSITVPAGTSVTYCYAVENTGDLTLTRHDVTDSSLGPLWSFYPYTLSVGASTFFTVTTNPITATTVSSVTWSAYDPITLPVTSSDMTTVTVGNASIVMTKTVGTDPSVCATTDAITVTAGTAVTYCYAVENTGDIALMRHDVTDSSLGPLWSAYPYTLGVGASTFFTVTTSPITATTVSSATWSAYDPITAPATSSDLTTVTVSAPTAVESASLGVEPSGDRRPIAALAGSGLLATGGYLLHRRRRRG